MRTLHIGSQPLTHQFFAIIHTATGWAVCLAGRRGLGTHYCKPYDKRFDTKKEAIEWRRKHLAYKPTDYWIAPAGKYTLTETGMMMPCHKTSKSNKEAEKRATAV